MAKPDPLSVACPRCGMPAGKQCNIGLFVYRAAIRSHHVRYLVARGE